jgi:trehalose 6-phosphate phosphatase
MAMLLPKFQRADTHCFFFDFDGTLTEIAESPGSVLVSCQTRSALRQLHEATGGAVAIITGREIEAIDEFLLPVKLPVSGVHGFERRDSHGERKHALYREKEARELEIMLSQHVAGNPGILIERKRGAVALHYRQRPELERNCIDWMESAVSHFGDVILMRGKMVIEAKFHHSTKGTAIRDFLSEPPFKGRIPVFAGDDVTDEDAFEVVNRLGGISIKIGNGESAARLRVSGVSEFLTWLVMTAETLKGITHRD